MIVKLLLVLGTWAVFGRCRLLHYEPDIPKELKDND